MREIKARTSTPQGAIIRLIGAHALLKKEIEMTVEESNTIARATKLDVRDQIDRILHWIKCNMGQDAEIFAKLGSYGGKFDYCHFAVISRGGSSINDAELRKAGWFAMGTATRAARDKDALRQSLAASPAASKLYEWGSTSKRGFLHDGEPIRFTASAPQELWDTMDRCYHEIAQALVNDWVAFDGDCWVEHTHVQLIPCERQDGHGTLAA